MKIFMAIIIYHTVERKIFPLSVTSTRVSNWLGKAVAYLNEAP